MTTDYKSKEKAFLESLKADSGRDLGEWMAAISSQNLAQRNDIIDWLRHQGFIFAWASWLERIHHNGGRPIYLTELPESQPARPQPSRPSLRLVASNPDVPSNLEQPSQPRSTTIAPVENTRQETETAPTPGSPAKRLDDDNSGGGSVASDVKISDAIAKGKAFAPLARHFLTEMNAIVPGARVNAHRNFLEFAAPLVFAALVLTPRGLRLCLDLGEREITSTVLKARMPNPFTKIPANLTQMVLLDDARQLDPALAALVQEAHERVNG